MPVLEGTHLTQTFDLSEEVRGWCNPNKEMGSYLGGNTHPAVGPCLPCTTWTWDRSCFKIWNYSVRNKELCCKVILNSISQWEMTADLESKLKYKSQVNLWERHVPVVSHKLPESQFHHLHHRGNSHLPHPKAAGLEQVWKCLSLKMLNN